MGGRRWFSERQASSSRDQSDQLPHVLQTLELPRSRADPPSARFTQVRRHQLHGLRLNVLPIEWVSREALDVIEEAFPRRAIVEPQYHACRLDPWLCLLRGIVHDFDVGHEGADPSIVAKALA